MKTFSRPEISGWKPAPNSISAEIRPRTVTVPLVGLVIAGGFGHLWWLLAMGGASVVFFFAAYWVFDRLRDSFAEVV